MKKYGDYDIDLITELLNNGHHLKEIEESFGYGVDTLRKYIRRHYRILYRLVPKDDKTKIKKSKQ